MNDVMQVFVARASPEWRDSLPRVLPCFPIWSGLPFGLNQACQEPECAEKANAYGIPSAACEGTTA